MASSHLSRFPFDLHLVKKEKPISKLTPQMIAQSRVIAKGNRIRDVQRLVDTYGGRKSKWVKKSSPPFRIGDDLYEYHWYEHHEIGRVEIKRKKVS